MPIQEFRCQEGHVIEHRISLAEPVPPMVECSCGKGAYWIPPKPSIQIKGGTRNAQ